MKERRAVKASHRAPVERVGSVSFSIEQIRRREERGGYIVGVIASLADLRTAIRMRQPPDFFEIRLDHLFPVMDQLERNISVLRAPLIITARHPLEGGAHNLSPKQRRDLLFRFLSRAKYIDVELRSALAFQPLLALARIKNVRRIISFHDFKSTPTALNLYAKARAAKANGADIFKVATRTEKPAQLARLLNFIAHKDVDLPVSAMGIGKLGAISRLLLAYCGSVLNYAALGRSQIEGQLPIELLRSVLRRSRKLN